MESIQENNIKNIEEIAYCLIFSLISKVNDINKKEIIPILKKLVLNICHHPENKKFKKLKMSNKNINELVSISEVYEFLYFLNFREVIYDDDNEEYEKNQLYFVMNDVDLQILNCSYNYLCLLDESESENESEYFGNSQYTMNVGNTDNDNKNEVKKINILEYLKSRKPIKNNNQSNNIKSVLIETSYKRRLNSQNNNIDTSISNTSSHIIKDNSTIPCLSDKEFIEKSIKERKLQEENNAYKYIINKSIYEDTMLNSSSGNIDYIGKEALYFTNKFRRSNNLNEVIWNEEVWRICYSHSKNMGTGKVPFSHEGFNNRVNSFTVRVSFACENLYTCTNSDERSIGMNAVDGWINSPGHRKNLLSNTRFCAIATFKSGASYFLTQIFINY